MTSYKLVTVRAVIVLVVWKLLKNQKNQKAKNCLSPKNCQKVRIHPILTLKMIGRAF